MASMRLGVDVLNRKFGGIAQPSGFAVMTILCWNEVLVN